MAEEGLLEPLVIIEAGDVAPGASSPVASEHGRDGEPTLKEEEARVEGKRADATGAALCWEQQQPKSQAREGEWEGKRAEESKNTAGGESRCAPQTHDDVNESLEEDEKVAGDQLQVDAECLSSCEQPAEVTKSPAEDAKQVCGADFCSGPFRSALCPRYLCCCLFSVSSVDSGLPRSAL